MRKTTKALCQCEKPDPVEDVTLGPRGGVGPSSFYCANCELPLAKGTEVR